jgi:transposase
MLGNFYIKIKALYLHMVDTTKFSELEKRYKRLTDKQWLSISHFFDLKRKRKLCLRGVLNSILWVLRTGVQWREIPEKHGAWDAIYYYFDKWKLDGTFEKVNLCLNALDRKRVGRSLTPSLLCVDSQSVKLAPMIFEDRGLDGGKLVNGRKRQILVDVEGRLYSCHVHAANIADAYGGQLCLADLSPIQSRLEKILGDTSYNGIFAEEVTKKGFIFEKSVRLGTPEKEEKLPKGFVPEAKRWVVERTFAWTNFFRRIVKDYEHTVTSSAIWMVLANITVMLQRIK